jgi:phosphatidylserine/phosphatidylglycerophosphate/cardiolipin synthase-like enzyme
MLSGVEMMQRRHGKITSLLAIFLSLFLILAAYRCSHSTESEYEAAFSPYGKSLPLVLSTINSARKSIHVAAYTFTSKPIAEALSDAHKRGVDVKVVADEKSNGGRYTAVTFLANQGVPVRLNDHYAILHNKFMVIDGTTLETGSFNYSAAAVNKNAENVLVIRDMPTLVGQYAEEWVRLWNEGVDVQPSY